MRHRLCVGLGPRDRRLRRRLYGPLFGQTYSQGGMRRRGGGCQPMAANQTARWPPVGDHDGPQRGIKVTAVGPARRRRASCATMREASALSAAVCRGTGTGSACSRTATTGGTARSCRLGRVRSRGLTRVTIQRGGGRPRPVGQADCGSRGVVRVKTRESAPQGHATAGRRIDKALTPFDRAFRRLAP